MPNSLAGAISIAIIRRLADSEAYQQGLSYFSAKRVGSLNEVAGNIHSKVKGTKDYDVTLTSDEGVLDFTCNCPTGQDGLFCKHCVAVALAWLDHTKKPDVKKPEKTRAREKAKKVTLADAEKFLREETEEDLVKMLIEWAKDSSQINERLILYAASRSNPATLVAETSKAFAKVVRIRGYLRRTESRAWANRVQLAIQGYDNLLEEGHAEAVVELCESALPLLLKAVHSIDDSNGHFAELRDQLEAIHLKACLEAMPDPMDLAKRLFDLEFGGGFDVLYQAALKYRDVLGDEGLKAYRQHAEAEWAKVPFRTKKGDNWSVSSYFRITQIMEALAKASGDVEELVAVKLRELTSAYHYTQISAVYEQAQMFDKALLWAEKGLEAFPVNTDPRLRELAAELYHRSGRHDSAMQLMWAQYSESPILENFKKLEKHAKQTGTWNIWRNRALDELRSRMERASDLFRDDHSLLIELFLHEGKIEDAWNEARASGCSPMLWLELAEARESEHPLESLPIYFEFAEVAADNADNEKSIELLERAARLMQKLGKSAQFAKYFETFRNKYKPKRNFQKLIEEKRSSLLLE